MCGELPIARAAAAAAAPASLQFSMYQVQLGTGDRTGFCIGGEKREEGQICAKSMGLSH